MPAGRDAVIEDSVVTLVAAHDFKLSTLVDGTSFPSVKPGRIEWLEEDHAIDLFYSHQSLAQLHDVMAGYIGAHPVDVFVQNRAHRAKRVFVADMESTIIAQEMLDELAGFVNARDVVADITHRAMSGELDFAAALRARVALLAGQPETILTEVAKRITPMPGAQDLLTSLKEVGVRCWLVTGGFTCFAEDVAQNLDFDACFANELIVQGGIIMGEVAEPILDKNMKLKLLERACEVEQCDLSASIAIGDGANDLPMLTACDAAGGLAIGYYAKAKVREVISNQIKHTDLSALIYALGLAH